jgi:hypothetical protein
MCKRLIKPELEDFKTLDIYITASLLVDNTNVLFGSSEFLRIRLLKT